MVEILVLQKRYGVKDIRRYKQQECHEKLSPVVNP